MIVKHKRTNLRPNDKRSFLYVADGGPRPKGLKKVKLPAGALVWSEPAPIMDINRIAVRPAEQFVVAAPQAQPIDFDNIRRQLADEALRLRR